MGKHSYEININTLPKRIKNRRSFTYDYCKTRGKNIQMTLDRQAVRISLELTASYDVDALLSGENHIVSDAIKKAMLLHLISYSENLTVRSMKILIDGEPAVLKLEITEKNPLVYSLISGNLYSTIPKSWMENPEFLQALLSHSKSKMDSRWSSLYALLCAKSKIFEAERFVYLWMAFNGFYGHYSSERLPKPKSGRISESEQITCVLKGFNLGNETVIQKDSAAIAQEVISVLRRYNIAEIRSAADLPEKLLEEVQEYLLHQKTKVPYDLSAYGYLLASFAYYFRCNIIHADKPLPLFSYADEHELKCLQLINTLLEEFLDNHLYVLFNEQHDLTKELCAV